MRLGEMAHRLETAIEHLVGRGHANATDIERLVGRVDAIQTRFEMLRRGEVDHSQPMPLEPQAPSGGRVQRRRHRWRRWHRWSQCLRSCRCLPAQRRTARRPSSQRDRHAACGGAAAGRAGALSPPPSIGVASARRLVRRSPSCRVFQAASSQSAVRVRSQLLDRLVSHAGEVSITRSRIETDVAQLKSALGDLTENLERLRRQLRDIELQAETQIVSRMEAAKASRAVVRPAGDGPLHAVPGTDAHDGRVGERRGHRAARPAAHAAVDRRRTRAPRRA